MSYLGVKPVKLIIAAIPQYVSPVFKSSNSMCAFLSGVKRTFLYHAGGVAHAINISTVAMPHFRVCSVITEIRKNKKKPGLASVK